MIPLSAAVVQTGTEYEQFHQAATRGLWTGWSVIVIAVLVVYGLYYLIRGRRRAAQSHTFPRDAAWGVAFVLVMTLSGPLMAHISYPQLEVYWLMGFIAAGITQWIYVIPAAIMAGRLSRPGFRNGALVSATTVLVLDLIAIPTLLYLARGLSHLR